MGNTFRENTSLTIQASANSTDTTSMWYTNSGYAGGIFMFNVTVTSATAILPQWTVQGRLGNTTKAYNVATLACTSTNAIATIVVYPGASTVNAGFRGAGAGASTGPNKIVGVPLPFQFRVRSTNVGSGTVTWSGWVELIN